MQRTQAIRLLMLGARGRMGSRIVELAQGDARFVIAAALDADDAARADQLPRGSFDAIVDFSSDSGASHAAKLAVHHCAALLVGTTGLSTDSLDAIGLAARSTPVMIAANTSLGVAVLQRLVAEAARLLGPAFDIDLIESHHHHKKDAPSGTALRLLDALRSTGGRSVAADRVHCLRAGDIVGEHMVQFSGPGEKIVISHAATTRDVFAIGALRAIHWLASQKPGLYTIEQSLGV